MLVAGRAFDGSASLLGAYERLTNLAGNTSWFTEFRPIPCVKFDYLERLLRIFFMHNVCCHISGFYASYLAGVTNSHCGVSLYIALQDAPILNWVFQRGEEEEDIFDLGEYTFNLEDDLGTFTFTLVDGEQAGLDIFTYNVSSSTDFSETIHCFGLDASRICGPRSNVDFVHLIWDNFERFYFRKYSLVVVPSPSASLPPEGRLVFLKYYRASSEGWKNGAQCASCVDECYEILRPFTSCTRPATCSCNICSRQPPTLQSMAVRVAINHVIAPNQQFELTYTTYQEYSYAVRSNRVTARWRLMPPEFPILEVAFRFHRLPRRFHDHCPGRGARAGEYAYEFGSAHEAIVELLTCKNTFWCTFARSPSSSLRCV
jgi:hypothetical protein